MGHGKETPRQKMIGMMYLVLMAMLALNVSNEVLNAFSVLDEGLHKTIETLTATNEQIIDDFGVQYQMNQSKVEEWQDKALLVKEKGDEIFQFIEDKKLEILMHAGEDTSTLYHDGMLDLALIKGKDKTDAPAYIMVGDNNDKEGKKLRLFLEEYRDYLTTNIVQAENAEPIRHSIEGSLDTGTGHGDGHGEAEGEEAGKGGGGHGGTELHSWESQHFEHLPMSGVMTILTGLQINVRNAQAEALKYLYSQIDAGSFKFNKLDATVIPNSNYIIKGNEYSAEVFLAASDTTASPEIFVTTDPRPYDSTLSEDGRSWIYSRRDGLDYTQLDVEKGTGVGIFKLPTNSLGEKYWGGLIELKGPNNTVIKKPFKKKFLVAEGSVTVSPTKMNVFYLGVDNPVEVSVAGVQPDKIDISVTNARHVKQGGSYIVRPIRPGNAFVVVYANIDGVRREMDRKEFRVKTVPDPVAMVNGQKSGAISQSLLAAQLGVTAEMENFDFDLKFTVTEFTVSATVQGFVKNLTSKSNRFTQEQKQLINSLSRGNNVYIQDIKAVGPDGSTRPLSTINFRLN